MESSRLQPEASARGQKAEGRRQRAATNARKKALGLLRSAEGQLLDAEYDLRMAERHAANGPLSIAEERATRAMGSLAAAEAYIRMARGKA